MEATTLDGDQTTDSRPDTRKVRRGNTRNARWGDVDINGELVDRLRHAVGDTVWPIDPDEHVRGVALEVMRSRAVAR